MLTRNKQLCNLLLVWCLGALVALIANFEMKETELFGEAFNFYFFPHVFEFGIPVLLFFGAMAGFTASVTRAVIMQILLLAALALNREYDPPTALAVALLLLLLVQVLRRLLLLLLLHHKLHIRKHSEHTLCKRKARIYCKTFK